MVRGYLHGAYGVPACAVEMPSRLRVNRRGMPRCFRVYYWLGGAHGPFVTVLM